jgi:hypothetical protein
MRRWASQFSRVISKKRLRLGDPGVVDEHVDSAELAHRTGDELLDLIVVTHVGAAEEDAASELADFVGRRLSRFLVDVGEADIGTLARKAERYLLADAASRSAHQDGLILKVHD